MCRSRVGGVEALGTLIAMVDEPTEIFDDLYLGLRAGGAMRKKRRGEPLTMEEEEVLGRWESLSGARKAAGLRTSRDGVPPFVRPGCSRKAADNCRCTRVHSRHPL